MAESALHAGRPDLAVSVFRAADQPGFPQCHLRQRCLQLTGDLVPPSEDFRVVR